MKNHSAWTASVLSVFATSAAIAVERAPSFEEDVRPLLKTHCWQCHGEEDDVEGNLDARLVRFLKQGGDSGPAIVPGNSAESLLYRRIASGEMPPGPKRLSADDVKTIGDWLSAGAPTARPEPESLSREGTFTEEERKHWSFQPIVRPPLPPVDATALVRTPIDAFLLARLEQRGYSFGEPATRSTLARRLSYALHGLPPSPVSVDEFLADNSPDSYERLVARMLASPSYGERWGRHWLDIVGYADSDGITKQDAVRAWAYKYRDYIIRAINENKPWDEFLIEQLAGDEIVTPPYTDLTPAQAQLLIATGFLRMPPDGTSGTTPDENVTRNEVVADVIKMVSTSLLGLSVGCARCHAHRYDPITHADYYRLRAVLEPAYDWKNWRNPGARLVSQWTRDLRTKAEQIDQRIREVDETQKKQLDDAVRKAFEKRLAMLPEDVRAAARNARETPADKRTPDQKKLIDLHPFLSISRGTIQQFEPQVAAAIRNKAKDETTALQQQRPAADQVMCLTEVPGQVPSTYLFARGDWNQPREEVAPGGLSILANFHSDIPADDPTRATTGRRLAYAKHLTSGRHPLVARVLVNRVWMHHFGRGLVTTPSDFGFQGQPPTHPELLDWLAAEFIESGWNLKHLHRLILTSTAYRQSTMRRRGLDDVDPDNELLGRMSVRRLEAEAVRDSLLALSGRLSRKMYGVPSPVSLDVAGQRVTVATNRYDPSGRVVREAVPLGEDEFRRTIYVQIRRSLPLSVLVPFDPPTLKPNCVKRQSSVGTAQSLMMLNDPFVLDQVDRLAASVMQSSGPTAEARFRQAWRLVLAREPSADDVAGGVEFLQAESAALKPQNDLAKADTIAVSRLCHALVSSNDFLYVD